MDLFGFKVRTYVHIAYMHLHVLTHMHALICTYVHTYVNKIHIRSYKKMYSPHNANTQCINASHNIFSKSSIM